MVRERVCQSTRTINSPHWVGADVNANTDIANIGHSNVANTGHDIANTGYSDASSTDALSGETTRSDKRAQQGQQEDEHRTHYSVLDDGPGRDPPITSMRVRGDVICNLRRATLPPPPRRRDLRRPELAHRGNRRSRPGQDVL